MTDLPSNLKISISTYPRYPRYPRLNSAVFYGPGPTVHNVALLAPLVQVVDFRKDTPM